MSRTPRLPTPIAGLLPPQQLPLLVLIEGPEVPLPVRARAVTMKFFTPSSLPGSGGELGFLHQGGQQTKFLSISMTPGRRIWLEPENRKPLTSPNPLSAHLWHPRPRLAQRWVKGAEKKCTFAAFVFLLLLHGSSLMTLRPGQFSDSLNDSSLLKAL